MLYTISCSFKYKDRKKTLSFKENFTIDNIECQDEIDWQCLIAEQTQFGKFLLNRTEFLANMSITINQELGVYKRTLGSLNMTVDCTQPYKKV